MLKNAMSCPVLGICFCTNENYAIPTVISMCSVLDNNKNAPMERRVSLIIYVYADDWSQESLKNLDEVARKYDVPLVIKNPSSIYNRLQKIDQDPWCGTFAADVRLFIGDEIEADYNIICLDSDVVMNTGADLYELAVFDLKSMGASCASTIDMQSSPFMKKIPKLEKGQHIYNTNGIFLVNPTLYKEYDTAHRFETEAQRIAYISKPYKDVVRNAYSLRNDIIPLPMKYQVYPAQKLLKISQWFYIFNLKEDEFYSREEIEHAIAKPVFVHFINFIVNKPWTSFPVRFPFQDIWRYYQEKTPYAEIPFGKIAFSLFDIFKIWMFQHIRFLYVVLCGMFYRYEVYGRNKEMKYRMKKSDIYF